MEQRILISRVRIDLINEIRRRMKLERDMTGLVTDMDVQNILDTLEREAEHQERPFYKDPADAPIVKAMKGFGGMEDAISTQAVLEPYKILNDTDTICIGLLRKIIEQLPPATPNQKMGRWIEHKYKGSSHLECSECSVWFARIHLVIKSYCPNCGAKMEES